MRSRDGVTIDESQKLLEDGEERPMREYTHALLHLHCTVGDWPAVDNTDQPESYPLPFRQSLPWVCLIELDSSSIHLRERAECNLRQVREKEIKILHATVDHLG